MVQVFPPMCPSYVPIAFLLVALSFLAGGIGLGAVPGEAAWWFLRPVWFAALIMALGIIVDDADLAETPGQGGRAGDELR